MENGMKEVLENFFPDSRTDMEKAIRTMMDYAKTDLDVGRVPADTKGFLNRRVISCIDEMTYHFAMLWEQDDSWDSALMFFLMLNHKATLQGLMHKYSAAEAVEHSPLVIRPEENSAPGTFKTSETNTTAQKEEE